MQAPDATVEDIVERLLQATVPIAFLDVLMLVRRVRQSGEPRDSELVALMALLQAPHTTDGARRILDEYLGACARRQENQSALAKRSIRLKDNGKKARVASGAELTLELEERRGAGWRWEVESKSGPIEIKRSLKSAQSPSTAVYLVRALRPGSAYVALLETPPLGGASLNSASSEPPRFELSIEIEAKGPA